MSEQECLKRCQQGDFEAFEQLIAGYQKKILNYCYRMLQNRSDAEDAAQEVFVKVFRFLDSYTGQSSFATWLYKIAFNVCMDSLRRSKRQKAEGSVSLYQHNTEGEEFALPLFDKSPTPYQNARQKAAQQALLAAISRLGEEQRQVVILRDIEGLSYEEIAHITGAAAGTVKSRLSRARLHLQKLLEPDKELFLP